MWEWGMGVLMLHIPPERRAEVASEVTAALTK